MLRTLPTVARFLAMNFAFSEEQDQLRDFVRSFLEDKSDEGAVREQMDTEQGFDEAVWSEGNPPWWGFHQGVKRTDNAGYVNMGAFAWAPGPEGFPYDTGGIMSGKKGEEPKMVAPFSLELYNTMDTDVANGVIDFVKRNAKSEKPFFVYYAGKGNHFWGAHPDFMNQPAGTNNSAQMAEHARDYRRLLTALRDGEVDLEKAADLDLPFINRDLDLVLGEAD